MATTVIAAISGKSGQPLPSGSCLRLPWLQGPIGFRRWGRARRQHGGRRMPDSPSVQPARGRVKSLQVVVLSTMLADSTGFGEWGFAAWLWQTASPLFDTGARPRPCCGMRAS